MIGGLVSLAVYIVLTGALVWAARRAVRTGAFPARSSGVGQNPAGEVWLFIQVILILLAALAAYPLIVASGI